MKRLTETLQDDSVFTLDEKTAGECYKKLSKLEDIEERLEIPLTALFKVLDSGKVFAKNEKGEIKELKYDFVFNMETATICPVICEEDWNSLYYRIDEGFDFYKYGKTWAATKEELE